MDSASAHSNGALLGNGYQGGTSFEAPCPSYPCDKLSIIMPVFNEGEYIYRNLHECLKELEKLKVPFEIVVVDDGSTDCTLAEARLVHDSRVRVVGYSCNQGKGCALKYGAGFVTGDVVTFMDSDLDLPPRNLTRFFPYLSNADIVIGSKRHPESKVAYPFQRRILSMGYQAIVGMLFGLGVSDTQTGMKLMRREFVSTVLPKVLVKQYAFDLELLVVGKKYGYSFAEAPIDLKMHNGSHVNVKAIGQIFRDTLAVAYRLHWLRYYDQK